MNLAETTSPLVMVKHFGVSLVQAQRAQALLRLGVTEQDVQIAERLMSSTPGEADNVSVSTSPNFLTGMSFFIVAACRACHFRNRRGEKFVGTDTAMTEPTTYERTPLGDTPLLSAFRRIGWIPHSSKKAGKAGNKYGLSRQHMVGYSSRCILILLQTCVAVDRRVDHVCARSVR